MPEIIETDVIVVGAGISGISAAYYLRRLCADRSFVILEGRSDIGGTWDLFRYPGVRSDSDMHTLGYSFKPWNHDKAIADGPSIMDYLRETIDEFDLRKHMRFSHHVDRSEWSSETGSWSVEATTPQGPSTYRCKFLFVCSGYYRYSSGYTPDFPGREDFDGQIVHPQDWPDDLTTNDKHIVVIGSGATAVTLVPELAKTAASVTMLQRSPTYVVAQPDEDVWANRLRRLLPDKIAYAITRLKNISRNEWTYTISRSRPDRLRSVLLSKVESRLGQTLTAEHFTPSYDPWDQRLCLVPNGDLYDSILDGSVEVVTDTINHFDAAGIELDSGRHLEADLIVTATGLQLVTLGEMEVVVDGEVIDFASTWTYRGVGYSGIPNLISTFGYVHASWTLRADMISKYVCRLLNHLHDNGYSVCVPTLRDSDVSMEPLPWIDDFSSGYMQRMMPLFPQRGDRDPWTNHQNYLRDRKSLVRSPIDDDVMLFR
jgi:monooxygenase